ncbi:penicillin-binding protein 2 [Paramagnetospirillum kuznetsovii]|uniref:Beta-lactamase n=1 Tax=Paramagnetospirillum kuznetsovii TaxID=2053833 RepID=A0A364NZ07_9PROT|nr:penicillin-binding protein 2 [Paramagnetospirillum kuznetsovii]RAU22283.1 penicillin-binding protein 2 [Paramagnetospirillum kuznetsovii]
MYHDNDRSKMFSRRALVLGGAKATLIGALAARMYYLQVMEADKFAMLAEDNRVSTRLLAPPRGLILDRNGIAMAVNQHNYRVMVVAERTPSLDYTLDGLSRLISIGDAERARVHKEARRRRSFVPISVRENLTWEEVARVEVNSADLPGVLIDVGQSRYYPLESLGAHILGYVSAVSENELTEDPLEELPGFRIGKGGVERIYDMAMRGRHGTSSVEVNAVGRVIRELERKEGEPGVDLNLSLDVKLQEYAAQRLGDESAAVVVMDIHTGDVIVMASTPSFDPNSFNRGLTSEEWKELSTNPRSPLSNKAIAGQFAPGSTFKLVTALAALESRDITPEMRVFCSGHTQLGSIKFHCWKKEGHGGQDLVSGIKNSCDVYFYEVARRTGFEKIAEMARRFGMGGPTGVDLPNERPGNIPDKAWKKKALKQPWHPGETLINAIGQGYVTATPIQLAVMTARIANGGFAVVPHVARDMITEKTARARTNPTWPSLEVSRQSLALVRKGMFAVSNEPGGTAYRARITQEGMWLSGKTGSAQVRRITMRERETGVKKNDQLPWKERDHALFVAYAPEENPRYSIAVVVEHGGGGSAVAAPIARDIMVEVQKRDLARIAEISSPSTDLRRF